VSKRCKLSLAGEAIAEVSGISFVDATLVPRMMDLINCGSVKTRYENDLLEQSNEKQPATHHVFVPSCVSNPRSWIAYGRRRVILVWMAADGCWVFGLAWWREVARCEM
jgi:hypothetical protein